MTSLMIQAPTRTEGQFGTPTTMSAADAVAGSANKPKQSSHA
jgi:hypothetical protein